LPIPGLTYRARAARNWLAHLRPPASAPLSVAFPSDLSEPLRYLVRPRPVLPL